MSSTTYAGTSCIVCKYNEMYEDNDQCIVCKPRGQVHRALSRTAKLRQKMISGIEQHQMQDRGEYYID